jgi:hypothetical protein
LKKYYIPAKYVVEAERSQECLFILQTGQERRNTVQNTYQTKVETYHTASEMVGFVCLKTPEEGCNGGR